MDENSAVGTTVGITASATDADVTDNITYTLDDSAGGLFVIDASSGVVTVNGALDAETATAHNITVRATSDDGSFSTQGFTINVNDLDEFDVGAISDTNGAADTVDEDAVVGTAVGVTAFATDGDVTDNITYTLSDDAGGRFTIDASTGVITVNAALDYETGTNHSVTVLATSDDGSTASQAFTINVSDIDEFDVGAISDTNLALDAVDENSAAGTTVGVTAFATDGDGSNNAVTYSLSDTAGGLFTIDTNTGIVTTTAALDAETATSYDITVRADSTDGSFATRTFTIAVNDLDEFDVGAVTDVDSTANSVDENSAVGTTVGITASASDADVTDDITYTLDGSAGGLFAIDASTGVVTVNGALDAETATAHNITVRATSDDGSFSTQGFTINVNDLDEFDVGAIIDTNATADTVAEDASVGTAVGVTVLATDGDVTDDITYSLSDDAGGRFTIDASTGVITVNAALDYETATSHSVTVLATSDDGSTASQAFTITVSDVDEFDVGAISDTDATADAVDENSAAGTSVGVTAFATDGDGSNNTVTYSLTDTAGGLFTIDTNTGIVTTTAALDAETAVSYDITVRADSTDGSFATRTFTIAVNDLDEFDVGAVTDIDATTNAVDENSAIGTSVGITASASDADGTTNAITYTLDDSAGGLFAIDASTGVVTVNGALNAETATAHNITVRATSDDGSFSTQGFTINVNDLDEFDIGAISDTNGAADTVAENASVGTAVGITALATDADVTDGVTYSLSDNAGGRFTIDASTGVITVNAALDYEIATSHSVTVLATSDDGSSASQAFTINVTDIDEFDVGAISDTNGALDAVDENSAAGTSVGVTAFANDGDGSNNTVTYSLTDTAGGLFTIDTNTGIVTTTAALDAETAISYDITVRADSTDGSFATRTFTIAVNDLDEFDVGTVTDVDATANAVDENSAVGTTVGITASASDADVTDNITYTLDDSAGGLFAIDASTGVVTVAGALDAETTTAHNITVRATSDDGSFSTQGFTINVNDLDEFDVGAISDTNGAADTVAEDASVGTAVGITALATDGDVTDGVTYSLSDNAGGRFTIDTSTGVITVNAALDYETATTHSVTVLATSDDGSTASQAFTINVSDIDEFDVGAISDTNGALDAVNENAAAGTSVGVTAFATDGDGSNNSVTYSLTDTAGGLFTIDTNTGIVTTTAALDAETATSYDITVRADSTDGSFATRTFTIAVNDLDEFDVGTVTDIDATANAVDENSAVGTTVGITASATDTDVTDNITYTLDDSASGLFAIDASTGVVIVNGSLDAETATAHNITVRATSDDGSFSTQGFTINVNDLDEFDVGAVTDIDVTANAVDENSAIGTTVGITASASDADVTDAVTYTLDDSAGGLFAIDNVTGVVTVNGALDAETATSYNITVRATSDDGSFSTQGFTINVNDLDEFDVGAISDTNGAVDTVAETRCGGTAVGITALATDGDVTDAVTYSLSDDAGGRFAIDASTGVITVNAALDYETATSHSVTVLATSDDGSTASQAFTITVSDVDEFDVGAISDTNGALDAVDENAAAGTSVGVTAFATDGDGSNNTVTYSLTDTAGGLFTIDTNTGIVTTTAALDAETATSYDITVRADSTDGSFATRTFTIAVNDLDEFDVGAVTDVDATANAVDENTAVGTTVGITASATDTDVTDNHHLYPGRQCRWLVRHRCQHGCGHRQRRARCRDGDST